MPKRVLSVGQCIPDESALARFLRQNFDVEVEAADTESAALNALRRAPADLVLVNRKLDADKSDGLAVLKAIKADAALARVPVMLVSNFADVQAAAVEAGGEMGFGKRELGTATACKRLAPFLE